MAGDIEATKPGLDADALEVMLDEQARGRAVHYSPQTDEERRLDKKVNFKLDLCVVSILALEFIVSTPLFCFILDYRN